MAQLTQLGGDDVAAIAAAYAIDAGEIRGVTALWAGTINSNFRLDTARGPLFLRVNEGKAEDEVAYEAELVAHLADHGVPTPRPLPARDGRPFAALRGKLLTLFPWVRGVHVDPPTMPEARALGEALARMHAAGASFPRRRESRYTRAAIRARAAGITAAPPEIVALLAEIRGPLAADADPRLPRGVIHGDPFPDNVLFDRGDGGDGGAISLLDFEQASDGELVYDLAVCVLSWCWASGDLARPLARAMASGYAGRRPLAPVEVEAFPEVCRFAALRFSVTRLTDVELAPEATPELRAVKDYRDFVRRWRRLVALGDDAVRSIVS
jgi:homoserine kinase type II